MNSFIVILSCLAAVTLAIPTEEAHEFTALGRGRCRTASCRRTNPLGSCVTSCPPRENELNCGEPDCNASANYVWLHPHRDPNWYWQCVENVYGKFDAVEMPCACQTLFQSSENRCIHWFDWTREDHCPNQEYPPTVSEDFCDGDSCPNCDEDVGGPGPGPEEPGQPGPEEPGQPGPEEPGQPGPEEPGNPCVCPCVPCIWWPCQPCATSCTACNQQQRPQQPPAWNQPQQPQPPAWNQPQPPAWNQPQPPSWNQPILPPQNNWQRPEQPQSPPQNNWQRPQQQPQLPPQNNWNQPPQNNNNNWQNWQRLNEEHGEEFNQELSEE